MKNETNSTSVKPRVFNISVGKYEGETLGFQNLCLDIGSFRHLRRDSQTGVFNVSIGIYGKESPGFLTSSRHTEGKFLGFQHLCQDIRRVKPWCFNIPICTYQALRSKVGFLTSPLRHRGQSPGFSNISSGRTEGEIRLGFQQLRRYTQRSNP